MMMRPFKFFQDKSVRYENHYTADILKRYFSKLDNVYCYRHNFPYESNEYGQTVVFFRETCWHIDNRTIINPSEIRSHVRSFFESITGEIFDIPNEWDMIFYNNSYIEHIEEMGPPLDMPFLGED